MADLNAQFVYNLGYAELNNNTKINETTGLVVSQGDRNVTKALSYIKYAADHGEISALNALAILYLYGEQTPSSGEWVVR